MEVSLTDLFLAYRQAKATLFFEKRAVGLVELAKFESKLSSNLRSLQQSLLEGEGWFSSVSLGSVWIVPKRTRPVEPTKNQVVSIGAAFAGQQVQGIDIAFRLTPSPEFAIVEVLYLWKFGPLLDKLVPKEAVGYRLDMRDGRIRKSARWLFEFWPKRYNEFRRDSLEAARDSLNESGRPINVISADLASFYDTVDASFLVSDEFVEELSHKAEEPNQELIKEFVQATNSLLLKHKDFQKKIRSYTGLKWNVGIPIGALTSRVIANVALASLDRQVLRNSNLICCRRYVDDLVIVGRSSLEESKGVDELIEDYIPCQPSSGDELALDCRALKREGCTLSFQKEKCKAHRLQGAEGKDFLDAIEADFNAVVSERRAFIDPSVFDADKAQKIIRAGKDPNAEVRSLRDADRTKLERFALSTSISSLELLSRLVSQADATEIVQGAIEGLHRLVADHESWVESMEPAFRLLGIAVSIEYWEGAEKLLDRMDAIWGSTDALTDSSTAIYYRNTQIKSLNAVRLFRNYLHEARLEAICKYIKPVSSGPGLPRQFKEGISYRTGRLRARGINWRVRKLIAADLRAYDHEIEAELVSSLELNNEAILEGIELGKGLQNRLRQIDVFLKKTKELNDKAWDVSPARLFLCTRPPSYFDIARRWLYRAETNGFEETLFDQLLSAVNSIRGTKYVDPAGTVLDSEESHVEVPIFDSEDTDIIPGDPRLILGNLAVDEQAFSSSLAGVPSLTADRLKGLAEVLAKAARAARNSPENSSSLLVLPELSLPRQWFRDVANYVVRQTPYGMLAGLEYLHHRTRGVVYNQAYVVIPGPYRSVATWPWTKRRPAHRESLALGAAHLSFPAPPRNSVRRVVVRSPWGEISVLICSELLEARRVADLLGRVELVLVPSWNVDTSSWEHLIQTAGLQLHAIMGVANNGQFSDCRAWAPRFERWERDLCRLIERHEDDIVYVDLPLRSLRSFHSSPVIGQVGESQKNANTPKWKPLPPDWS